MFLVLSSSVYTLVSFLHQPSMSSAIGSPSIYQSIGNTLLHELQSLSAFRIIPIRYDQIPWITYDHICVWKYILSVSHFSYCDFSHTSQTFQNLIICCFSSLTPYFKNFHPFSPGPLLSRFYPKNPAHQHVYLKLLLNFFFHQGVDKLLFRSQRNCDLNY